MRRFLMLAAIGLLAAFGAAAPASAKGPTAAMLNGPGLSHGLPVKGQGEGGYGTPLGALVQFGGFFEQAFGQTPDPTTPKQPAGDLGPRYRVVYRVPGPSATNTLVQDVYPYAKPRPVTHMAAGQRFFGGMRTHGGWFVAAAGLKPALVKAGLPASPPPASGSGSFPWAWAGIGTAIFVLLLILALRRRGIPRLRTLRPTA